MNTSVTNTRQMSYEAALSTFKAKGQLGVTKGYFVREVVKRDLPFEVLDNLLYVRQEFGAGVPDVLKLLDRGFDMDSIVEAHRARYMIQCEGWHGKSANFSIRSILKFMSVFPEVEDADDLSMMLQEAHAAVVEKLRWVYPDESLKVLCRVAERYGITGLEAAIDALDLRTPRA